MLNNKVGLKLREVVADKASKSFWDVFIISEKGEWRGVRTPKHTLQRLVLFVAFLILVSSLAIIGVVFGRWKISKLQNDLAKLSLDHKNLSFQYSEERDSSHEAQDRVLSTYSLLPRLDVDNYSVSWLELDRLQFKYDHGTKKCDVSYRLNKKSLEGASKGVFYSVVLLQSSSGIITHPAVLGQNAGRHLVDYLKGSMIRKFNRRLTVSDSFPLRGFVDDKKLAPVQASLLIYDDKGNLLYQSKQTLTVTNTREL